MAEVALLELSSHPREWIAGDNPMSSSTGEQRLVMSAAPRIAWGRAGTSPSNSQDEPRSVPPPDAAGSPRTPVHGDLVWFLGDIITCFTHYFNGTIPCHADEPEGCPECTKKMKVQRSGFAPALFRVGGTEAQSIWQPRTLRVPTPNIDLFGANLRGRQYRVEAKTKGTGNRKEYNFRFVKSKVPPIEAFDAGQVMQNIWYPRHASKVVVPPEVLVSDDTLLSPTVKAKSFLEEAAGLSNADLVSSFRRFQGGPLRHYTDVLANEIERRGIVIDQVDQTIPDTEVLKFSAHQSLEQAMEVLEEVSVEIAKGRGATSGDLQATESNPHLYDAKDVRGKIITGAWAKPKESKVKGGAA